MSWKQNKILLNNLEILYIQQLGETILVKWKYGKTENTTHKHVTTFRLLHPIENFVVLFFEGTKFGRRGKIIREIWKKNIFKVFLYQNNFCGHYFFQMHSFLKTLSPAMLLYFCTIEHMHLIFYQAVRIGILPEKF